MTKEFLIIVDSGPRRGLGHLMRSLALGREFQKKNYNVRYLIEDDYQTKRIINDRNFQYLTTDFNDLLKQKKFLEKLSPEVIVTDLFKPIPEFLELVKEYCSLLVSIDDYNLTTYCSDIIINPNLYCDKDFYQKSASDAKVFCGPKYFIMIDDFHKLHLKNKKINEKLKHSLKAMEIMG
jgi:spore coat polysaccharide biosynthesis predicted glycosyltransferase SpsG